MEDNYSLFERREAAQERWLARRPVCAECGEPIQEEFAVRIGWKWYCMHCIEENTTSVEDEIA